MSLRDEQADILGGPILQRPTKSGLFVTFSQYHLVLKSVTLFGLALLVWIACARGLEHLKKHRELKYRKAMRRKHGIPDSDCRPFAVAYAAAKRAHLEREAQDPKKATNYVSDHNPPAVDQQTDAQKDARGLRRRVPETSITIAPRVAVQLHDYQLPGKYTVLHGNNRPEVHSLGFADRYNPNSRKRVVAPEPLPVEVPHVHRASRRHLIINPDDNEESRKRSFEDESDVEHEIIKKSRIDGDEPIDRDEQADWYAQYSDLPSRTVHKESLDRQPDVHIDGQERSRHVNELRNEYHEPADEAMEAVDDDEVTELKAATRGKKRDRAEAGSTFGGDDDDDVRNGRTLHHRKRRTISRRVAETPARGQKRDRESEPPEGECEGGGDSEASQRRPQFKSKKGDRRTVSDDVSEVPAEDPRVSKDPLCGGRRVGEEWEVDGARYKVSDKGERLRLTLVRKARNKYHMPQDSQHPDRSAALEIYVETWMTEDQYKQAEGKQELAWQESSRESSRVKSNVNLDSPTKNGKSLLWDSVKDSYARRPPRQITSSGALTRINPFEQWHSRPALGRRVASSSTIVSSILPSVADSPTRPGLRGFSKWEKQDREAEAMARIRAKIEEQKKAQLPPEKPAEMPTSVTAPELGKPTSIPTIILISESAAEGKLDDNSTQSKLNAPTFSPSTCNNIADSTKGMAATTSTTAPLPPPPPSFPGGPSTSTQTTFLSPFSFAKPLQVASSTSTAVSPSAVPNFFGKDSTAIPVLSTSSPSTLSVTTQPQPLSTEIPSKTPFSFAKPDASSSTSFPAVAVSLAKSETVSVSATPSSSSPAALNTTLATDKSDAAPPASIPLESSKSTIPVPLFSFSGASPSTATLSVPSVPPVPKFSFGQPSSTFTPGTTSTAASQLKPTFKFGQTSQDVTDGSSASTVPVTSESKSAAPTVFDAAGSNEPARSSPFGTPSPAANISGKQVSADSDTSASTPPKTMPSSSGGSTTLNMFSSVPTATVASTNASVFSFGGTGSGSKSAEGSKPTSLLGGAVTGSNPTSAKSGGNFTEGKPAFAFGTPAESSKPATVFSGNTEGLKSPSVFGSSFGSSKSPFAFGVSAEMPKPSPSFGGAVQGATSTTLSPAADSTKSTSVFAPVAGSSKPSSVADASKNAQGSTAFGSFSPLTFTFNKGDAATNTPTSIGNEAKPTASFTFGVPSGATGSTFGQPSTLAASDPNQTIFGKPPNTTPSTFGFPGSSSAFTFGKSTAQNQKQEQ